MSVDAVFGDPNCSDPDRSLAEALAHWFPGLDGEAREQAAEAVARACRATGAAPEHVVRSMWAMMAVAQISTAEAATSSAADEGDAPVGAEGVGALPSGGFAAGRALRVPQLGAHLGAVPLVLIAGGRAAWWLCLLPVAVAFAGML